MKFIKNLFKNEYIPSTMAMNVFETKNLTLVALLAAVYALGSFLPGFPMIGVSGSKIDVTRSLEMGYGLLLGPVFGPIAAFLGAVVGKTLTGGGFGMFFTPLAPVSSFVAAALSRRRVFGVEGWKVASAVLAALIAFFYASGVGLKIPLYPILHVVGLVTILLLRGRLADYVQSEDRAKLSLGVALCSFPATMAGHMLGNIIYTGLLGPNPALLMGILPITVVERITLTILATIIATPLLLVVRGLFPYIVDAEP
jgi:hypothetical protein